MSADDGVAVAAAAAPSITFLERGELVELLLAGGRGTVIIDVRDDDYEGGHIKGAHNRTSDEFTSDERIDAVMQSCCAGASRVVFHCLLSQVLRGGFSGFSSLHAAHPQLFENFSEAHWRT